MHDLTKGSPLKVILVFAIPILLGSLLQQFYSLADARIVGMYLGDEALESVGATTSLTNMLTSFLMGMTNGFTMIIARHYGAGDNEGLKRKVASSFTIGITFSIVISALSIIFLKQILGIMKTPEDLMEGAGEYFRIIMMGLIFSSLYNVCAGVLRSVGDSMATLIFLLISTIANVGLDLLFVGPALNMGVRGAAIATIITQGLSFALSIAYMLRRYELLHFPLRYLRFGFAQANDLLSTGLSMGFMLTLINLGDVFLQSAINSLKDNAYIAAQFVARKITGIYMLPFGVFGAAMGTYVGQNYGAGEYDRIRKGFFQTMLIVWGWCVLVVISAYTIAPRLIRLISATNDDSIIENAAKYLRINTILYFVCGFICVSRNALQALGHSIMPVVSSMCELACKVFLATAFTPMLGYTAIIYAEPTAWIIMIIPLLIASIRSPLFKGNKYSIKLR